MPRPSDPTVRDRLVDVAARLLFAQEPLSIRRLAVEAGTSTMAVYTHFGGIEELMQEVRREGFRRLADHLTTVGRTSDPVADLIALGWAHCLNGLENPSLYRAMFFETSAAVDDEAFGASTFLPIVDAVQRAIDAGRLTTVGPYDAAVQMWSLAHGLLSLALSGMLTVDEMLHHLEGGIGACLVGFGDGRRAVDRSVRATRRRMLPASGLPESPAPEVRSSRGPAESRRPGVSKTTIDVLGARDVDRSA